MIPTNKYNYSRISAAQLIPENIFLYGVNDHRGIFQVEVDPIDYCNHKCGWCFTADFRHDKKIPLVELEKYLASFSDAGGKSVVFSGGGEPLLYKEIYKKSATFHGKSICRYLIDKSIHVGIITNGLLLPRLLHSDFDIIDLSFIRISLDSTNENSHSKLHQTSKSDFHEITHSIQKLLELRGQSYTPAVGISFVVDSFSGINYSKDEIVEINQLACRLKVDFVQFKHIHTNQKQAANDAMDIVHSHCVNLNWNDVEFWVQSYDSANDAGTCLITQYIQSIGKDMKKFPCCHLFGREEFLEQSVFLPQGKTITNCNNKVCRYNEMNKLLLNRMKGSNEHSQLTLETSIVKFGFHPYRFCPTAPNILTPFNSQ